MQDNSEEILFDNSEIQDPDTRIDPPIQTSKVRCYCGRFFTVANYMSHHTSVYHRIHSGEESKKVLTKEERNQKIRQAVLKRTQQWFDSLPIEQQQRYQLHL